jgi:hypothetical protein
MDGGSEDEQDPTNDRRLQFSGGGKKGKKRTRA